MQSPTDFSSKGSEAFSPDDSHYSQHVTQEASAQTPSDSATDSDHVPANAAATGVQKTTTKASWLKWYTALKNILPTYIAIHLAFFVTTCLAVLFVLPDFSWQSKPIYTLWQSWHHWDVGNYMAIAKFGYDLPKTVFFPLYPLLERGLLYITRNPDAAGLLISNVSGLVMLVVLYQLVKEDFDQERALRTVLYISLFPTAFFLAVAYNESLFVCFTLLSFYQMRHGHWWLAGLFGLLASLTRSAGLFLLLPFCYEYLRQHHFKLKMIRLDILAGLGIPAGIGVFAIYCYFQFHDLLAFLHQEAIWHPRMQIPGVGILLSISFIRRSSGLLSFQSLHNMFDLIPALIILVLLILSFVGPWKLPSSLWAYSIYAVALYIFFQLYPTVGIFPLQSVGRYMLEVFPAFIILASMGKSRTLHLSYLMTSGITLFFLLTQFLMGRWVL